MRISKTYKPELVASREKDRPDITDPFLDVPARRVLATNGHSLVSVPVDCEKGERSRYLSGHLLKVARTTGKDQETTEFGDEESKLAGLLWPAEQSRAFPDWKTLVPRFRRGDAGTVTLQFNAGHLKRLADSLGVAAVAVTARLDGDNDTLLVQPLDVEAEEFGVLIPPGPGTTPVVVARAGKSAKVGRPKLALAVPRDRRRPVDLEATADAILERAGAGAMTRKDLK